LIYAEFSETVSSLFYRWCISCFSG